MATAAAEPSRLPYYGYRLGEALVRVLPRSAGQSLGTAAARLLVAVAPRRFDGLRSNLRQVLSRGGEAQLEQLVRRNVQDLARSWVDVMAMRSAPSRRPRRLRVEGYENFASAMARGRGAVIASMHFGAWESGLAMWNERGHPMALLAEELRPRQLFERIAGARGALGVQVIPLNVEAMRRGDAAAARRAGMAAMREVVRLLRANVPVAIALDRDLIGNGTPMTFFGRPAPIPLGVVEVAVRSGAAVVPIALLPGRGEVVGRVFPEITYDSRAPREAEVRRVTADLLRLWEDLIRERPELWHVLEPIWEESSRRSQVA